MTNPTKHNAYNLLSLLSIGRRWPKIPSEADIPIANLKNISQKLFTVNSFSCSDTDKMILASLLKMMQVCKPPPYGFFAKNYTPLHNAIKLRRQTNKSV